MFNLFTGTVWSGTHYDCKTIVLVLRGIAQGTPTLHLAEELNLDYSTLLDRRHRLQEQALCGERVGLPDREVEADEMYQNAGGKVSVTTTGPTRRSVNHSTGEWARDADEDGRVEVHCNTIEGIWTGLRNFLRPFRGVHKKYLAQYVAMFEWTHDLKSVTGEFLRMLMQPNYTFVPT